MNYFFKIHSSLLIISIILTLSVKSQQHRHNSHQNSLKEKTGQQLGGHEYDSVNTESLDGHPLLFEILEENPQNKIEERINNSPNPLSLNNQLFQKYLGRGLLTCGTKYIGIIQQLNRLIMSAHKEYSECQHLMNSKNGQKLSPKVSAQLEMINELLNDN
ncbi:hypothetical protein ACQ4LE_007447 [Meloidogyne hapla]|uniref:Uncharacterized protein n=1 Tax=Meloidogyne hapla TaxID=6305 RepID=A0A1I8BS12_MELHA